MTVATDTLVSLDAIRAAADRISGIAVKTPQIGRASCRERVLNLV